jgi:hypothetical protein
VADDLSDPSFYAPTEEKYGLPSGTLFNLAGAESSFNPGAYNPLYGATGLMQFIPETAKRFGIDPTDPKESVEAAGQYLNQLVKQKGSLQGALSAYGGGLSGYQHEAVQGNRYASALLGGAPGPSAVPSGTMTQFEPVTVAREEPSSPGNVTVNLPSVQAPADMGRNPLASLMLLQVLQAQLGGTHKFTPVDYDPWKVAGQKSPFGEV